jgi:hypothetical protein
VGLRTGLDTEARGKILFLFRGSNPGRPVCSQILYCLSYSDFLNNTYEHERDTPYTEIQRPFLQVSTALLLDDFAGKRITTEFWWTNQE